MGDLALLQWDTSRRLNVHHNCAGHGRLCSFLFSQAQANPRVAKYLTQWVRKEVMGRIVNFLSSLSSLLLASKSGAGGKANQEGKKCLF